MSGGAGVFRGSPISTFPSPVFNPLLLTNNFANIQERPLFKREAGGRAQPTQSSMRSVDQLARLDTPTSALEKIMPGGYKTEVRNYLVPLYRTRAQATQIGAARTAIRENCDREDSLLSRKGSLPQTVKSAMKQAYRWTNLCMCADSCHRVAFALLVLAGSNE